MLRAAIKEALADISVGVTIDPEVKPVNTELKLTNLQQIEANIAGAVNAGIAKEPDVDALRTAIEKAFKDPAIPMKVRLEFKKAIRQAIEVHLKPDSSLLTQIREQMSKEIRSRRLPLLSHIPSKCEGGLQRRFYFDRGTASASAVLCVSPRLTGDDSDWHPKERCSVHQPVSAVKAALRRAADDFRNRYDGKNGSQMLFVGYTDSTGQVGDNIRLAGQRAVQLKNLLIKSVGSETRRELDRIAAIGRGEEVRAPEFSKGELLLDSWKSRRVDIYHCG